MTGLTIHPLLHGTLVRSVAVHSMKTLRVSSVMREWWPLMMGGMLSTTPSASRITGYTALSRMMGRYCFRWLSP